MYFLKKSDFIKRRKTVLKLLKENEMLIIKSNPEIYKNGMIEYPYKQNSNFYYLTGLNDPNCILIMCKQKAIVMEMLFVEKNNPKTEIWIGKRKEFNEISEISGIESIMYIDEYNNFLKAYLSQYNKLYYEYRVTGLNELPDNSIIEINEIKNRFPNIREFEDINNLMFPLRIKKDKNEIKTLQYAIDITDKAIRNAMKKTKPGMKEYEIRAEIEYVFIKNGVKMPAFNSIVASGKNATVLHYTTLNSTVQKDDLILIDIGADWNNYSADISRTYPANGKFQGKKKYLYEALLDIQKSIIDYVKPGLTMKQVHNKSVTLIKRMLKTFKYIKNDNDYIKYYPHLIGHMLGLDTHDVQSGIRQNHILKENMIITIEPGVYIKEHNIGIRIEDNILIIKNGNKNLSANIPKEIKTIERIMEEKCTE